MAAIALAPGGGGEPERRGEFFGMTRFGQLGQTGEAEEIGGLGVERMRVELGWGDFQRAGCDGGVEEAAPVGSGGFENDPGDGAGRMDEKVRRAAEHGLEIVAYLYGTRLPGECPDDADVHRFPAPGTRTYGEYIRFVEELVARYGVGGRFWLEPRNSDLPSLPIRVWEVWNEPNLSGNDPGGEGTDPGAYGRFLIDVSRAIRGTQEELIGEDPHEVGNRVLFGGVYGGLYAGEGRPIPEANRLPGYLRRLYGAGDEAYAEEVHDAFDGLAFHPYRLWGANGPAGKEAPASLREGAIDAIRSARQTLDAEGDGDKELWITEIGWPVGFPGIRPTLSAAEVSGMMSDLLEWVWDNRDSLDARYVAPFTYMDRPPEERCSEPRCWAEWTGLKTASGESRPLWRAYGAIVGGERRGRRP